MDNEIYIFVLEMYGEVIGRKESVPTVDFIIKQPRAIRLGQDPKAPNIPNPAGAVVLMTKLVGLPEEFFIQDGLKFYWICKDESLRAKYIQEVSGIVTPNLKVVK